MGDMRKWLARRYVQHLAAGTLHQEMERMRMATAELERWENLEDAAREAYEAYGYQVGWKNYQGQAMPVWEQLPLPIKQAWAASARRVMAKAYRIVAAHVIKHVQEDCDANCRELGIAGD